MKNFRVKSVYRYEYNLWVILSRFRLFGFIPTPFWSESHGPYAHLEDAEYMNNFLNKFHGA